MNTRETVSTSESFSLHRDPRQGPSRKGNRVVKALDDTFVSFNAVRTIGPSRTLQAKVRLSSATNAETKPDANGFSLICSPAKPVNKLDRTMSIPGALSPMTPHSSPA